LDPRGWKLALSEAMVDQKWFYYHDVFNLIALPIVVVVYLMYLFDSSERYFYFQHFLFLGYLIVDTIWLLIKPDSVASAASVLPHHAICIIGWNAHLIDTAYAKYNHLPLPGPKYARFTASGALVEINTFLLILRRNWRTNAFIEFLFYATWVAVRCVYYPYGLVGLYRDYFDMVFNKGSYINVQLYIMCFFTPLNIMNLKWTIDLVKRNFLSKKKHDDDHKKHSL
jgi:hypothetical protein